MIPRFRGKWTQLSNYAPCSVWYDKHIYSSVEHAYQAAKTLNDGQRADIRHLPSPNQAKKAGRRVVLRSDWNEVKLDIMEELLRQKFSQQPFQAILLSSENEEIVEGNWWGDTFWGQCPLGTGTNYLGELLMKLRGEMQTGQFTEKE